MFQYVHNFGFNPGSAVHHVRHKGLQEAKVHVCGSARIYEIVGK
jgi:hypothetical protein